MKKLFKRQNLPVYSTMSCIVSEHNQQVLKKSPAFSLVEMLMALLVASLLLAALAPVITRKVDESVTISGNMNPAGTKQHVVEIEYGSQECSDIKTDADGSTYCEGEFTVPGGYNGYLQVTVIGAGGGGGTAPTAGYTEYTNEGSTNTFTVPAMTGDIEATLVSGGGGGETDTVAKTHTFVTYNNGVFVKDSNNDVTVEEDGTGTWTIPVNSRGKDMIVTACGGGGGGGCSGGNWQGGISGAHGYGGGSGGYINKLINFNNESSFTYYIGGGGAGGTEGYNAGSSSVTGLAYGGGSVGYSLYEGGHNGALLTSTTKGGTGGIGIAGTCTQPTCMTDWTSAHLTKGGDGGSPAGGEAAVLHRSPCYTGKGGGGGGASQIVVNSVIVLNAPGGGGGGGSTNVYDKRCPASAGGGGGGGEGGGNGGTSGSNNGKKGAGGADGSGISGGTISTIFGGNYCNGGNSSKFINSSTYSGGYSGKSGAIRLTYIDTLSNENTGGGAGNIVKNNKLSVSENENLTIKIGSGGKGGTSAYLDKSEASNPKAVNNVTAEKGSKTLIEKNSGTYLSTETSLDGTGKNGGTVSLFNNEITCTAASSGTSASPNGVSASGYGCGGGGAYAQESKTEGGKGSGGYARIAWNKYWDEAVNAYKMAEIGAGGGGAAGNALTHSIPVKSNQTIKFRIGKGGNGAYVINNVLVNSKKGGDTVFENIKAGGGKGGESTGYNSILNILTNGKGGSISDICHFGDVNYINNNKKCRKSTSGGNAENSNGGSGANFVGYSYTLTKEDGNSEKKEIKGTGGVGGIQDTGENSNGKNAEGIASGGGGASIRDLGKVNSSSQSNIVNNPTKGGNGGNGKIILEWWQ